MNNPAETKFWAIVPAAGVGRRMGADVPKQYLSLHNKAVIEHTLHRLSQLDELEAIIVAIADDDPWWSELHIDIAKSIIVTSGGEERCHSVQNALAQLTGKATEDDWILVHDAARPCVRPGDLHKLVNELRDQSVGGLLGIPVRDTMKRTNEQNGIVETVERNNLWHALTPQMFRFGILQQALLNALDNNFLVTDEASAVEYAGHQPVMIEAHADNIKITRPEDLALASFYLQHQAEQGIASLPDGLDDGG